MLTATTFLEPRSSWMIEQDSIIFTYQCSRQERTTDCPLFARQWWYTASRATTARGYCAFLNLTFLYLLVIQCSTATSRASSRRKPAVFTTSYSTRVDRCKTSCEAAKPCNKIKATRKQESYWQRREVSLTKLVPRKSTTLSMAGQFAPKMVPRCKSSQYCLPAVETR